MDVDRNWKGKAKIDDDDDNEGEPFDVDDYNEASSDDCDIHEVGDADDDDYELPGGPDSNALLDTNVSNMVFETWEHAEVFYNNYAKITGFSIRKQDVKKDKNNAIRSRKWVCSRQGLRKNVVDNVHSTREPKSLTRTGCEATFKVVFDAHSGVFKVTVFESKHNHLLATDSEVQFLRSHRRVTPGAMAAAKGLRRIGATTAQVMNFHVQQCGGYANVGYTRRDLYNRVNEDQLRQLMSGDAEGALGFLGGKATSDDKFFCKYDVDEEHKLRRIFWNDGKSQSDYEWFGDVLVFDATYNTNAYRTPLVILCGVNNYYQTVIFGVALILDETGESYSWLLHTFLESVGNKFPVSVITDGDLAMKKAIVECMPFAHHRICSWHLNQNASKNVHVKGFGSWFKEIMNYNCSPEEFDLMWHNMVQELGVADHPWVRKTFESRKSWARAYLRAFFFANQISSQRCESMNSLLKKHVSDKLRLYEFVAAIDFALTRIRNEETRAKTETEQSFPHMSTSLKQLEMHAATVYTRDIYSRVRQELKDVSTFILRSKESFDGIFVFEFHGYADEQKMFCVYYYPSTAFFKCTCMTYEYCGWPCSHMLAAMVQERMVHIPEACILNRWTNNVYSSKVGVAVAEFGQNANVQMARFGAISSSCNNFAFYASHSEVHCREALSQIREITDKFKTLYTMTKWVFLRSR